MKYIEMSPRGQRLYDRCKKQLGYSDISEQPHAEMLNYYANHLYHLRRRAQTQDKAIELVPRGCFKTSACTIGGTIDALAENPNLRVLIATHTHGYSKEILGEIKWHLERNEDLRDEMGDVRTNAPKWAEEAITFATRTIVKKEPTINTCALDNPIVGGHYDLIVVDDIHTRENITPKLLRKARHFIRDLRPVLEPGGVLMIIGTRWHNDDIYGWLFELNEELAKQGREKLMYDVLTRGCYDGPGDLYFPTRLTEEFLDEQRLAMDDKTFACQYLNKPLSEATALFPPSLIHRFEGDFVATGSVPFLNLKLENAA